MSDCFHVDGEFVVSPDGFVVARVQPKQILRGWDKLGITHWADAPGKAYREVEEEEQERLAALFAAAPDLLDALRETLAALEWLLREPRSIATAAKYGGTTYDAIPLARAAIGKAVDGAL